jgi:hypothetical protein
MVSQLVYCQSIEAKYDRCYGLLFASQEQRARVSRWDLRSVLRSIARKHPVLRFGNRASRHRRKTIGRTMVSVLIGAEACLEPEQVFYGSTC